MFLSSKSSWAQLAKVWVRSVSLQGGLITKQLEILAKGERSEEGKNQPKDPATHGRPLRPHNGQSLSTAKKERKKKSWKKSKDFKNQMAKVSADSWKHLQLGLVGFQRGGRVRGRRETGTLQRGSSSVFWCKMRYPVCFHGRVSHILHRDKASKFWAFMLLQITSRGSMRSGSRGSLARRSGSGWVWNLLFSSYPSLLSNCHSSWNGLSSCKCWWLLLSSWTGKDFFLMSGREAGWSCRFWCFPFGPPGASQWRGLCHGDRSQRWRTCGWPYPHLSDSGPLGIIDGVNNLEEHTSTFDPLLKFSYRYTIVRKDLWNILLMCWRYAGFFLMFAAKDKALKE